MRKSYVTTMDGLPKRDIPADLFLARQARSGDKRIVQSVKRERRHPDAGQVRLR